MLYIVQISSVKVWYGSWRVNLNNLPLIPEVFSNMTKDICLFFHFLHYKFNSSYFDPSAWVVIDYLWLFCLLYLTSESIPCLLSSLIVNLLEGSTFSIGIIWYGSTYTRERRAIYMTCLNFSFALMCSSIFVYGIDMLDIHTVHWVFKVSSWMWSHSSINHYFCLMNE